MTLTSLRSQKNVDVNIIVVDSGSTDETLDTCKPWNVKTLYAQPGNIYRAINIGLHECDTECLGYQGESILSLKRLYSQQCLK